MFLLKKKEPIDETVIRPADLNRRMLAVGIDLAILLIIIWPLLQGVARLTYGGVDLEQVSNILTQSQTAEEAAQRLSAEGFFIKLMIDNLLQLTAAALLVIPCWLKFGATPGKYALRMRVVDSVHEKPLTLGRAIGRFFAYAVSMFPLGLGILWIGIDKQKQGWHDKIAGTKVIILPKGVSTAEKF